MSLVTFSLEIFYKFLRYLIIYLKQIKKFKKKMLRKGNTFTLIDDESDLDLTKIKLLGHGSYGEVPKLPILIFYILIF